ncbi:MAG: hypothetical protein WKG07_26780 [Hymenobacter sp.]
MTEPTNPLFEDEKEFLERKKLEYERALRGDVAEIKATTVQAGKVAAIGAGLVGSIWLITKAFSGGKSKKKKKDQHSFDDYAAGFDSFDNDAWETDDWVPTFQEPDYEDRGYRMDSPDGFYFDGPDSDLDDNGLSHDPDFPPHSAPHHGVDTAADEPVGSTVMTTHRPKLAKAYLLMTAAAYPTPTALPSRPRRSTGLRLARKRRNPEEAWSRAGAAGICQE